MALWGDRLAVTQRDRAFVFDFDGASWINTLSVGAQVGDYFTRNPSIALTAGEVLIGSPLPAVSLAPRSPSPEIV